MNLQINLFYPDLIDKTKAPTYKIIKEPGNDETVILLFQAGPPYEDIGFRIVNKYAFPCRTRHPTED